LTRAVQCQLLISNKSLIALQASKQFTSLTTPLSTSSKTSSDESTSPKALSSSDPFKKSPTAYSLFVKENFDKISEGLKKDGQKGRVSEVTKVLATNWKSLSEDAKKQFAEEAHKLKEKRDELIKGMAPEEVKEAHQKHLDEYRDRKKQKKAHD